MGQVSDQWYIRGKTLWAPMCACPKFQKGKRNAGEGTVECPRPMGDTFMLSLAVSFRLVCKKRQDNYIMIKGSIRQEDVTALSIYAPNTGKVKYINIVRLKGRDRQQYNNNMRLQYPTFSSSS